MAVELPVLHVFLIVVRYTFLSVFVLNVIEMTHKCVNSANNFCYVCGEIKFASRKGVLTSLIKPAYILYFACKVGDQGNS
jgi:hypothetical protein